MKEEKKAASLTVVAHKRDAGLFSHINFLITVMEAQERSDIHVDWREGLLYCQDRQGNLFESLFAQLESDDLGAVRINQWPHYKYTSKGAAALYRGSADWRARLNQWWRRLRVLPDLLHEVEVVCGDWCSNATALHIRNRNIGVECPDGIAPNLTDYAEVALAFDGPVYLATDNAEAVEYFRRRLGGRLVTRDIPRAKDMSTEYHLEVPQSFEDARNCLIDALVMARCRHLIHSVSNIATSVLYMNPGMSHTFVCYDDVVRRDGTATLEEREYAENLMAKNPPLALLRLEHPRWKDWIFCYEGGVFKRHQSPERGFWSREAPDALNLRWFNWNAERFCRAEPIIRGDAFPHAMNRVNTLRYRHSQRIERMVLKLSSGLGNQMFQYAFGLGMARERRASLLLSYKSRDRSFGLGMFGLRLSSRTPKDELCLSCYEGYDPMLMDDLRANLDSMDVGCISIEGYFQNEACFASVAHEVRELFSLQGRYRTQQWDALQLPSMCVWVTMCEALHISSALQHTSKRRWRSCAVESKIQCFWCFRMSRIRVAHIFVIGMISSTCLERASERHKRVCKRARLSLWQIVHLAGGRPGSAVLRM
jgi:hypothetical protein